MDGTAVSFAAGALGFIAVVLAACGLFLVFVDIDPGTADSSLVRRRLAEGWRALGTATPPDAPAAAIGAALRAIDQFVFYWFEQSERNVATSGAFTLIVLVAIPLAALTNWLRGGSPFLILFISACALGLAVLAALAESGRGRGVAQLLAICLCAAIFLFVPAYVFVSLTDHTLNMPIGHAALSSILVVPLLYLVCHSAVLLTTGAWGRPAASSQAGPVRRFATLWAAMLPISYLAVFACLILGHIAAPDEEVPATWQTLLIGMAAGALSATVTVLLTRFAERRVGSPFIGLCAASAVAVALALGVALGASDWLIAVPLAPPLMLWAGMALALLAKGLIRILGDDQAGRRPYMVAGLAGLIVAAGAGWASALL